MQPQYIPQQQGVTVVTQNDAAVNDNKLSPSALGQMRVLSILQVIMGVLCLVFGIVLVVLDTSDPFFMGGYFGQGIWCGIYFILVGAVGLEAVKSNTECFITATMVLNIICSALFWYMLLSLSSTSLGLATVNRLFSCYFESYYDCDYTSNIKAIIALNSLMMIMALAELVITIWSAVLCCGAICRCCKSAPHSSTVQYNTTPAYQQQAVVNPGAITVGVYSPPQTYPVQGQMTAYPAPVHQQPPAYLSQPQVPPSYQPGQQGSMSYQQPGGQTGFSQYPTKQ